MSPETTPINDSHITRISAELAIAAHQIRATADLLAEGATVPFISRYRKEATGSLDEVAVAAIRDRLDQLAELDKRREAIFKSLQERDLLTDELAVKVATAPTLGELEDIYLPFRPKRRTRATIARERGLDPFATLLLAQDSSTDPEAAAAPFIDPEKGVADASDALAGARDIIAETVSEHAKTRARLRALFIDRAAVSSRVLKDKEADGAKFKDYFDWSERAAAAPSHRILAMLRGEAEGFLALSWLPPEEDALRPLRAQWVNGSTPAGREVEAAVDDSYKRLLAPSMENELRAELKRRADDEAIRVFAENLRELLLAPPLGQKRLLALDPGFRTGCKLVCLDRQGKLVHNDTIYPHTGGPKAAEAGAIVAALCQRFEIEAIAIGNGTAGRETETFVRSLGLPATIPVVMVNESGASIYSASDAAREEFPEQDLTVRGSVSIGRRLMDPLAELVKIDAKSIGVGQYQHDVDQAALRRGLDDVVMSCVNGVGVDVNTASKQLLTYVSGLGPQLAGNIVAWRDANGAFQSRAQLRKVPRLGPKAFEQSAGFLRIRGGKHPLDASAVHPESYGVVDAMAADLGCTVTDLMRDDALRARIDLDRYVSEKVGLPTLRDILAELARPGRDPREQFEPFSFAEGVQKIEDLTPGLRLPGIVTNVTAFGAFVDIGVHQDGLVHVSQLADRFVKDPSEVVKVQQHVSVVVMEVDFPRKRIALSMKSDPQAAPARGPAQSDRTGANAPPRREERRDNRPSKPAAGLRVDPKKNNWFADALNNAKKR